MRRSLATLLLSVAISLALLCSFLVHLFRDVLPYPGDDGAAAFNFTLTQSQSITLRYNLAVHELPRQPPPPPDSILFPDWETLLLLPLPSAAADDHRNLSCLFHDGALFPAGFVGTLPTSPARAAFRCQIPNTIRCLRRFYAPRLVDPTAAFESNGHDPHSEMSRWNLLAYEAVSTPTDVIVFAKGVNTRQGVNRPASGLRCLFSSGGGAAPIAATPATSSAQEVFHCPHPPPPPSPARPSASPSRSRPRARESPPWLNTLLPAPSDKNSAPRPVIHHA